jgi:hypothetical protein
LRSWLTKFGVACGTISLAVAAGESGAASGKPAIVLVDNADLARWQSWAKTLGWLVIAPTVGPNTPIDGRVEALETAAREAIENGSADHARIYLAGSGEGAAAVFYTISRQPDPWAAGLALGGSPQAAIDTGRLYAGNFTNVPLLWAGTTQQDQQLAGELADAGLNLEWRSAEKLPVASVLDWLGGHTREDFPKTIDCETPSATFSRCYWIRLTKLDGAERNDVLASSRITPAIKPALDLGPYGYKIDDPGPGILISFLPEKYNGPLKMGDRIVQLDGRQIADARGYNKLMGAFKDERPIAVMIERRKERVRLETSVILPRRAPEATARVHAKFDSAAKEVQILSRTVAEMQVTIPPQWTPGVLTWNGVPLEKLEAAQAERCFELRVEKELESSRPCP